MAFNIEYFAKTIQTQSDGNSKQWKQAYDWGNHTASGYITGLIDDTTPVLGGNLNLNTNNIIGTGNILISGDLTVDTGNLSTISFNINNESALTKGQLSWDDAEGTLSLGLTDNSTIHFGEHRYFRIRNQTGDTLYKGQAVYATGIHNNGLITPAPYVADGSIREVRFMGIMLENVNNNNNGYVIDFGHLHDMDLDGSETNYAVGDEVWSAGDILYIHPTVAGKLTKVEPKHSISVAIVLDPGNGNGNGRLFVRPISYGHLDDNHDVSVSGVTNGQFLQYNSSTDYWIPSSSGNFTTLLVNGTGVSLNGHTHVSGDLPVDVVYLNTNQTLTNKTLDTPDIIDGVFSDTFTIGSQVFYEQSTNGFSVNEDFDPSNSSTQTAYHFTTGPGRETLAFTLARTSQFTDGFGIYGTSSNNTFVTFGEQSNTKFEWRKGVGIRPLDLDGGTLLMDLDNSGNLDVMGSGNFQNGLYIDGSTVVKSDISSMTEATGVNNIVTISQNGYNNLAIASGGPGYDPNTLYFIV